MTANWINPECTINAQLGPDGHAKLLAVLVWKLSQSEAFKDGITLTSDDMKRYVDAYEAQEVVLFTHAHKESIELKTITMERAKELAAWDAKRKGRA